MPSILFSAPYMIPSLPRFKPVFEHCRLELITPQVRERLSEEELLQFAGQFDGAICGDDAYTRRVLDACAPRLKVISKWGTGIDSIDSEHAESLGIRVCRTLDAFTLPVSDSILGYMLAFARRQPWMDREMKSGRWEKLPGRALHECTLGIIGVGFIGKALTRKAGVFGIKVLGNDIIDIDPGFIAETGIRMLPLEQLLPQADFIAVCCTLNPTSRHLINARTLAHVKPGAVLINTARGPVVEETALITALQSGRLAGAALDVFEVEPLPINSPLMQMDNVMLAPHNANSSPQAWERVHWNTIRNLLDGLGIAHKGIIPNA